MYFHLTAISTNKKTGPIPVSTSSSDTCPASCAFKGNGCYAQLGPIRAHWDKVSDGRMSISFDDFLVKIKNLPPNQLWRHNQAGDLAGIGEALDIPKLLALVEANRGKRGFTYTHKTLSRYKNVWAFNYANQNGFTINYSCDNEDEVEMVKQYYPTLPLTLVVPQDKTKNFKTKDGHLVVICPAVTKNSVTCASCKLCAWSNRKVVIGFPAHGAAKRKVSELVSLV